MTAKTGGYLDSTARPCGYRQEQRKKFYRRLIRGLSALITLTLLIILISWLILRPSKPQFALQNLTLTTFNVSNSPSYITTTLQLTLLSRNPNKHIGIYYDKLELYAAYRSQQITAPSEVPPVYQGHREVNMWSPILSGNDVSVAPNLAVGLDQDRMAGRTLISIKGNGRVRWKVGTIVSRRYHLSVNCVAYINFGPSISYQLSQSCNVDV